MLHPLLFILYDTPYQPQLIIHHKTNNETMNTKKSGTTMAVSTETRDRVDSHKQIVSGGKRRLETQDEVIVRLLDNWDRREH